MKGVRVRQNRQKPISGHVYFRVELYFDKEKYMTMTACVWCSKLIKVKNDYDDLHHKGICSQGCKDAESIFCVWMSDEAIHRRTHYHCLTTGKPDG